MSLVFSCLAKHIVKRASLVFSSLPTSMKIRVWNESVVTPFQERERPEEICYIPMRSSSLPCRVGVVGWMLGLHPGELGSIPSWNKIFWLLF